jgi:hypothetical protein
MDRTEALAVYRRVRGFGWPRRFPIAQFPNNALITAFVAGYVAAMVHGAGRFDAQASSEPWTRFAGSSAYHRPTQAESHAASPRHRHTRRVLLK